MHNMTIKKLSGVLALAMALTAVPLSASATEASNPETAPNKAVNEDMAGSHINQGEDDEQETTARLGLDPGNVSATGVAIDVTGDAIDGYSVDTDIAVWGHTKAGIVYSVDVEWGAMTFQYETSSWDPETHTKTEDGGWYVYDSVNERKLTAKQDAINRITVANHSNAPVGAKLSYTAVTNSAVDGADYSDTTGTFQESDGTDKTAATDSKSTFTPKSADADDYLELESAVGTDRNDPPIRNAYFMPEGIKEDYAKDDGIAKWTKIGVITVSLEALPPEEDTIP